MPATPHVLLCGVPVAPLTKAETIEHIFECLARGDGGWMITLNVDILRRYVLDPEANGCIHRASLIVADGCPILWAASLQGTRLPERVAGSDLVWSLAERAAREARSLYLLGGDTGAGKTAMARFKERWPELMIVGWSSPRLSARPAVGELEGLRAELERLKPDIVYVGLGNPKQEAVIELLRPALPGTWWLGIGISLSFVAGQVVRAPIWMQRFGLEWLHRMIQEPIRLTRRYLIDDLPFLIWLLWHVLRSKR